MSPTSCQTAPPRISKPLILDEGTDYRNFQGAAAHLPLGPGTGGRMRFAASNGPVDRIVAAFVLAYATWTIYVHALVATQASFTTLLRGLPLATVAAAAAIAGWFRLREP